MVVLSCPVAHGTSFLPRGIDGKESVRIVAPKIIWPTTNVYYDTGPTKPTGPNSGLPLGTKLSSSPSQNLALEIQYKLPGQVAQTTHEKALIAAQAARAAAGKLLWATAQAEQQHIVDVANKIHENELDAIQRMENAIWKAHEHADMLPGHQFAHLDALQQDDKSQNVQLIHEQLMPENNEKEFLLRMCGFNCSGHGKCNTNIGCQCSQGWTGKFCDSLACPDNCNNNGMCIGGKCICSAPFYGDGCQHKRCINDCSSHGYCFKGRCQCSGDYGGESCAILVHVSNEFSFEPKKSGLHLKNTVSAAVSTSDSGTGKSCTLNCNGHGTCWNGKCNCNNGWSGLFCQNSCPNNCSGNGKCNESVCTCLPGYSSLDCSLKTGSLLSSCHDSTCSGRGTCNKHTNSCECNSGFHGPRCQFRCPQGCSGRGTCVNDQCVCWPQWGGKACNVSNEISMLLAEAPLLGNDASNGNDTSVMSTIESKHGDRLVSPKTALWLSPSNKSMTSSPHLGTALLSINNKSNFRAKPGQTLKSLLNAASGAAGKWPMKHQKQQRRLEQAKQSLKLQEQQPHLEQVKPPDASSMLMGLISSWVQ